MKSYNEYQLHLILLGEVEVEEEEVQLEVVEVQVDREVGEHHLMNQVIIM